MTLASYRNNTQLQSGIFAFLAEAKNADSSEGV